MPKPILLSILTTLALIAVFLVVVGTRPVIAGLGFPSFKDSTAADLMVATIGSQIGVNEISPGEHLATLNAVDEARNSLAPDMQARITVQEQNQFRLDLAPGWNLVSLPASPVDPSIDAVFGGVLSIDAIVTSVDVSVGETGGAFPFACSPFAPQSIGADCVIAVRSGGGFVGTIRLIEAGKGYWVRTDSFEPVIVQLGGLGVGVAGQLPRRTPPSSGFNLIGLLTLDVLPAGSAYLAEEAFSTLKSQIGNVFWFDTVANRFNLLSPDADAQVFLGRGYYVSMSGPGVLLPEPTSPPSAVLGADVTGSLASLPISPGWNFVSLPGRPANALIDAVLPQSVPVTAVITYDPDIPGGFLVAVRDAAGSWAGPLRTIQDGKGYYFLSSSLFTLSVALTPFEGVPQYPLAEGWNAVGVTVTDSAALEDLDSDGQAAEFLASDYLATVDWLGAYLFDTATQTWQGMKAGSQSTPQVVKAGKGYWLYVAADAEPQPPSPPPPIDVAIISDDLAPSDTVIFSLTGVTLPAANTVYEGWLVSDDGSTKLSTGILTVSADGSLSHTFSSPTGENFIANYDKVVITVEPVPDSTSGPSDDVVFMDQVPASGMAHIRHLLTEWPAGADAGILTNLRDQIQVAIDHANLAKNSSTLDGVKLHIHHVINIIEGEGGLNFDASFGNPGDGIGVLTHAQDRKHASFARITAPGDAVIAEHSELVEAYGENAENWSILARDQALNVLNLNSLVGAQTLAGAVGAILQDALNGIAATGRGGAGQAYVEAQLMATYTLAPCGDLNGDGGVNVFDAIIDLQIIVGLITPTQLQLILGDVVRDGTINVFDAILVLQDIVGLTVITECGPPPA